MKYIRRKYNLTQKQLAKQVGVSVSAISAYETGKYDPSCLNCTPFVRQYDIMSNRWGDFNAKGSTKQTIHAGIQEAGRGNHDERKDELQRNGSTI